VPVNDDVPTAKGPRPDAFVSYRRLPADTTFVDRLQDTLSARGKQLWVDRTDIEPAADSWERIAKGIRAAKAFIFVITPESVASRQCRRELDGAAAHHKLIVPVVLRDVDLEGLPGSLSTPNWIYFTADRDFEESLGQVLRALENDLQWRDDHARLADRADEWARSGRDRSFVLHGRDLRSALDWLAGADQHRSVPATDLQAEYIAASRKAAMRTRRARRTALAAGLAIALGLTAYGLTEGQHAGAETQQADRQHAIALSRLLASRSVDLANTDPVAARRLAVAAWYEYPTDQAESAMAALLTFQERNGALPVTGARVVTFSPDGRVLAAAGSGGIRLWDAATAMPVPAAFQSASSVSAMAFSPDGRLLASGDADGYLRLWDAATGRLADPPVRIAASRSGSFHPPLISSVAFSPDGTLLAIGDIAGYVHMLRPPSAQPAREALLAVPERFGTGSVTSVAFSPDGRLLATAGSDGEVRLWNPATGETTAAPLKVTEPDALSVTSVTFSPDGRLLATGDDYGVVRMWNPATGRPVGKPILANPIATELVRAGGGVNAVAFSPDGKMLASADADGGIGLWNPATGKAVGASIPAASKASNGVTSVAFNPRTGLLASASPDGYVRLWNAAAGSPIGAAIPYNPIDPQLSSYYLRLSSEDTLLTRQADGYAETWTDPWTDPHPREAGQHDWSGSRLAAFSPDGKILAVTSYDGLHLTDPVTFADLSRPLPPSSDAYAVAFSPDGKLLASADHDGRVRLWNPVSGRPLGDLVSAPSDTVRWYRWRSARTASCWPAATAMAISSSGIWPPEPPSGLPSKPALPAAASPSSPSARTAAC